MRNTTREFWMAMLFPLGLSLGYYLGYHLPKPTVPDSGVISGYGEHYIEVDFRGYYANSAVRVDGKPVVRAHVIPRDFPESGVNIWLKD